MLDFLFLISAKPVVVTLATIGAILATFSVAIEKFFTGKTVDMNSDKNHIHPAAKPAFDKNESPRPKTSFGRWLNRLGYGIMGVSVILFIIAGFIVDLRG